MVIGVRIVDNESSKIQQKRVADLVLEQLMDWIMDGKIRMGQKLNTEELAQRLGVSRMPVREALKTLEKQGIAESVPYVGSRVVKLTKNDVRQIYIMRKALEPVAAYYTCQKITKEDIDNIEEIQTKLETEMQKQQPSAKLIYIYNREFHFAIYQVSGLTKLCDTIKMLWDNLAFYKLIYGLTYVHDRKAAIKMIEEHRGYISDLKAGNEELLQKRLSDSLERHQIDVPYKVSACIDDCIDD
jgi:DNA-binding GntR family transcriptional regulator